MIATKGLVTVDEQIAILKSAKEELPSLTYADTTDGLCLAIRRVLFDKNKRLYHTSYSSGINTLIPSFTRENAVLSKIGEVGNRAYWWSTRLSKGGLTNRLAFLDWLINELEKSKTIK